MSEWKEGKTTATIHDKAFNAGLTAIYPTETGKEKSYSVLQLKFEDESTLSIFGMDKVSLTEGTPGYTDIGKFLESLAALGYKYFWGTEGEQILGFKTEPDIIGKRLWLKPVERKGKVGSAYEDQIFKSWTVEKIEGATETAGTKKPASKPETKKEDVPGLDDWLVDKAFADKKSKSMSELWKLCEKKWSIQQIREKIGIILSEDPAEKEKYTI